MLAGIPTHDRTGLSAGLLYFGDILTYPVTNDNSFLAAPAALRFSPLCLRGRRRSGLAVPQNIKKGALRLPYCLPSRQRMSSFICI